MIDDNLLYQLENYIPGNFSVSNRDGDYRFSVNGPELIELARLGLWAKEHAIPELKIISSECACMPSGGALSKLPPKTGE